MTTKPIAQQKNSPVSKDLKTSSAEIEKLEYLVKSFKNSLAEKAIQKALKRDPKNPELYFLYGNLMRNKGSINRAMTAFSKAIKLNPDFKEAYSSRGQLKRDFLHNFKNAETDFNKAEQLEKKIEKRKEKESKPMHLKDFDSIVRYKIQYSKLKSSDPVTRWGGLPNNWKGFEVWPVCGHCKQPLAFVMQVTGNEVDLKGNKALQIFVCVTGSECELYLPSPSYANKVFLTKAKLQKELCSVPENTYPLKGLKIKLKKSTEPSSEARDSDNKIIFKNAFGLACCDKFYGLPATGNDVCEVKCSRCSKLMVFLGQFTQGDLNGFEEWFISVLLICPKGHEASFQGIRG
jgi:tetratricopeptide (TPR) repeat protein